MTSGRSWPLCSCVQFHKRFEVLNDNFDSPSAFTPEELLRAVRAAKALPDATVPAVCVHDFDGDPTDWLVLHRNAIPFEPWACYHTKMYLLEMGGTGCGIIPRTIGGPYVVLIAEQLPRPRRTPDSGLTSVGRVSLSLPFPVSCGDTRRTGVGTGCDYLVILVKIRPLRASAPRDGSH